MNSGISAQWGGQECSSPVHGNDDRTAPFDGCGDSGRTHGRGSPASPASPASILAVCISSAQGEADEISSLRL